MGYFPISPRERILNLQKDLKETIDGFENLQYPENPYSKLNDWIAKATPIIRSDWPNLMNDFKAQVSNNKRINYMAEATHNGYQVNSPLHHDAWKKDKKGADELCKRISKFLDGLSLLEHSNLEEKEVPYELPDKAFELADSINKIDETSRTNKFDEINSILGNPNIKLKKDIFVLMPFKEEFKPIYEMMKKSADLLSLTIARADDFSTNHIVMNDVWSGIYYASIVIADCTNKNPNVFYEIGLAHALGKSVILITQNENDVSFDLRHIRFIKYNKSNPLDKAIDLINTICPILGINHNINLEDFTSGEAFKKRRKKYVMDR